MSTIPTPADGAGLAAPAFATGTPDLSDASARALIALEAAGVGTWEWDVASDARTWDEQARAIFGIPSGVPVTTELMASRFAPGDHERWRALVEASLRDDAEGAYEGEFRLLLPDGGERWVHTRGRVLRQQGPDGGRSLRMVGAMRDVTARRGAEIVLAEREERLRAALYASRTGTFRWDIGSNALDWDENLDRLFGLAPGSTVRSLEGFVAMVHPDDRARVIGACVRCRDEGADFDEEFRVVWPDGSIHWLDDKGKTFPDASGTPAYMTGACVEITDRKRAEEEHERIAAELRASEARLRRIMASGIVGSFFWSLAGGITEANDAFLELLGYTRAELAAGRIDWRALTPPAWTAADAEKVAELLATGRHGPYEKEYLAADGRRVPVLVASAFFEGSTEHGVALCIDLTARRAAERALAERERELREALDAAQRARAEAEEARRAAETANQAKSAFLATMSHELRTPLNAIGGYAELMEMGIRGAVTPAQQDDLGRIRRSQAHLLSLINDVLNFAKLDAGAVRFEIVELDVADAVTGAEAMVGPQMAAKGLRFATAPGAAGLRVRADAEKLRQVLLNLLSNATKFTDRGGTITTAWHASAATVAIEVRDTGCGIPADRLESVFEPFVQIDRQLSRPSDGVGLGLAISRELARAMGGDLTATSDVNTGSTFTVTLPRAG